MSTTHSPMPDFADALERHLREAASELSRAVPVADAPSPWWVARRARSGRRPLAFVGSLGLVAAIVAIVLLVGGGGPTAPKAVGAPLVLRTPVVVLPEVARPGFSAEMFIGPDAVRITRGHRIATAAGPAFLYGDARGRCLTFPDPSAPDPARSRGVTCVTGADFRRAGIAGWMGDENGAAYLAAIPQGVRSPTVSFSGGPEQELRPSDIGVVAVTTTEPAVVTRFDARGRRYRDTLVQPIGPQGAEAPRGTATTIPPGPDGAVTMPTP